MEENQKIPPEPETKCWGPTFLLLHSHRDYGIYGMGIP